MKTAVTEHLTTNEFIDAAAEAQPGDPIIYALGDLASSAPGSNELLLLRGVIWKRYQAGLGHLTQRRIKTMTDHGCLFEYIYTVATPRRARA